MRRNLGVFVAAGWFALSSVGIAQSNGEPQYSAAYQACLTKTNEADFAIAECANAETERQDKALNEAYRELTAKADPKFKPDILKAERAWMAYRDAECDLEHDPDAQATTGRVTYSTCMLRMTYDRVHKLREMVAGGDYAPQ